jgi:hypothetical protein
MRCVSCIPYNGALLYVDVPSAYRTNPPALPSQLAQVRSPVLRALLEFSNGLSFFVAKSEPGRSDLEGFRLFNADEAKDARVELHKTVEENRSKFPDEWASSTDYSSDQWRRWFDELEPIASWDGSGDLLVIGPQGHLTILEHPVIYAGPFEPADFEGTWETIPELLAWIDSRLVDFLNNRFWRYTDDIGRQYVLESIR